MSPLDDAGAGAFAPPPPAPAEGDRGAPLSIRGLTVAYGAAPALFSIDLDVEPGAMTAIVGPNGAGKSSLLRGALGITPRLSGDVRVFGEPFDAAAGRVAYVPQRADVDWSFPANALDVVLMGRFRGAGLFRFIGRRDRALAMAQLDRVGMADFADRQIGRLSGGQQQRVFIARALAQDAALMLLDEPFAGVDAATERRIVEVLQAEAAAGRSIVCVHHDLSTLRRYFDRVVVVNRRKIADGPVDAALTIHALQQAYGGRLAETQLEALQAA